jgi:hypothetical protein
MNEEFEKWWEAEGREMLGEIKGTAHCRFIKSKARVVWNSAQIAKENELIPHRHRTSHEIYRSYDPPRKRG